MTRNVWLVIIIKHYDDIVRSSFKDEKIKLEIMKTLNQYLQDSNYKIDPNYKLILTDDYHLNKYNKCKEQGINLVHIFEFEDLESWKENLSKYIKNQSKYEVKFENNKRTFSKFSCYGVSKIILLSNE